MAGTAPMSEPDFRDLMERLEKKLEEIGRNTERLSEHAARAYPFLGPLRGKVAALLQKISELYSEFVSLIGRALFNPGVPWTLWYHGSDWSGPPIGGRVSEQAGRSTANALRVDNFWLGRAATAYKDTLGPQEKALTWIKTAADDIDDVLTKVAIAIVTLWVAILGFAVTFTIESAAEAAAGATGIGVLAALLAHAATWKKLIAGVSAAIALAWTFFAGAALSSFEDLHQRLSDSVPFPDGRWPKATEEFTSDGSITDGDTTAWRLTT